MGERTWKSVQGGFEIDGANRPRRYPSRFPASYLAVVMVWARTMFPGSKV